MFREISAHCLGLSTIGSPFTVAGFCFVGLLAAIALSVSLSQSSHREKIDRGLFWAFGLVLVAFAVLRPIGLARDDLAYLEILKALCPAGECAKGTPITRDYVWYGLVKLGLPLLPGSLFVAFALSGLGVLIKLFVIDRLCSQKLLALLLYIPICYVQYDLTQLRAGLAISWMFLGIYAVVRSSIWVGAGLFFTNGFVHSQAFLSPALLCYRVFGISRWVLPTVTAVALLLIYTGFYPRAEALAWLEVVRVTIPYYSGIQRGAYEGVKIFPWSYFFILGYGIWLCNAMSNHHPKIVQIVSAGLALGMLVAWFFAINPTIQTRVFEFYAVPLVLLAGNVGDSRSKILTTCILALVLYFRIEVLHDWILG